MFERTALPAGPRVISARLPSARSVSIAAYVLAGSRLETAGQIGVAHFMEHLTFKGTAAYPSTRAISEAIEGVGGSFNAATDRESTVYWVRVPRRETERAMDVVGELIVRPRLEAADIQSERAVIIEEIRSYLDDPSEYCQILFQTAMFGDGPLGREICGEESDIAGLPAEAIHDFWRSVYRPANTVVAVVGDLGHDEAVALTTAAFGTGNGVVPGFAPAPSLPAGPRVRTGRRDTSQAQICLGVPALHRDHPDSWTLAVLNAVLGDGMSSRLFLSVREELGLAYDVSSGLVDYADAGALEVSAGVDPDSLPAALEAILAELARLRDELVPEAELTKAKRYLSGGLELRMDDTRHVASWIGGQEALHDRVLTLEEALAAVDAVDAAAVQRSRRAAVPRRRDAARRGRSGALSAWPRAAPAVAVMTAPAIMAPPAAKPARTVESVLAHAHLRLGALSLARVELETMAGLGLLDVARPGRPGRGALADRRPARCRRGGQRGAARGGRRGGRAGHRRRGGVRPRPSQRGAADGQPGAGRRPGHGRPDLCRHAAFDACGRRDAAEPPPTAPTLFDREPDLPPRADGYARTLRGCGPPAERVKEPSTAAPVMLGFWDGEADIEPAAMAAPDRGEPSWMRAGRAGGRRARQAALHFGLALRVAPALAPAVLEATEGARSAGLSMVRGDAYRLAGHETSARQAYAMAARGGPPRAPRRERGRRPIWSARRQVAAAAATGLDDEPATPPARKGGRRRRPSSWIRPTVPPRRGAARRPGRAAPIRRAEASGRQPTRPRRAEPADAAVADPSTGDRRNARPTDPTGSIRYNPAGPARPYPR